MTERPEQPASSPGAPQSIEYARDITWAVRRHGRMLKLLLILTLMNTILLGSVICGPVLSQHGRQAWEDYKSQRRQKQLAEQTKAAIRQCMGHTAASDDIVYEEHPAEAARLATADARYSSIPVYSGGINMTGLPSSWHAPVCAAPPPFWRGSSLARLVSEVGFTNGRDVATIPTLFMHGLKGSDGRNRLVWVGLDSYQQTAAGDHRTLRTFCMTRRFLTLVVAEDGTSSWVAGSMDIQQPLVDQTEIILGKGQQISEIRPKGLLRFYAGQLDPSDPSHFTLAYALDGKSGTIDGWLRAQDRIILQPREGNVVKLVSRLREPDVAWRLSAAPTTRSTTQPQQP